MSMIARQVPILPGNPGIFQTLERMKSLIHADRGSLWLQWASRQVVQTVPPEHSYGDPLIWAVYEWVLAHMVYTVDGQASDSVLALEEEIRAPNYLLHRIYNEGVAEGDCDDFVILIVAMLCEVGIGARFIVTSARDDREFDHVFLQAWTGTRWVTLDGIHGAPVGWAVPAENVTNLHTVDV